ncbi:MAG: 2'-5' RNA ligase family protein [Patescibacteria group bacterium]
MNAFIVGCEIEPLEEGHHYAYKDFPLHCTLVHWFKTESNHEVVGQVLSPVLKSTAPFRITSLTQALFGKDQNIPVHKIKKTNEILTLHKRLIQALKVTDPTYTIPWLGDSYEPHVTDIEDRALRQGESFNVTRVYLAEATDSENISARKVIQLHQLR